MFYGVIDHLSLASLLFLLLNSHYISYLLFAYKFCLFINFDDLVDLGSTTNGVNQRNTNSARSSNQEEKKQNFVDKDNWRLHIKMLRSYMLVN